MINIYVLYHAMCTDGVCASYTAWALFKDKAIYLPIQYNQDLPEMYLSLDTEIYIVDFCPTMEQYVHLKTQCKKVQIIDHHDNRDMQFIYDLCYLYAVSSVPMLPIITTTYILSYLATHFQCVLDYLCKQMNVDTPIFDFTQSGAVLSWIYFHPDEHIPDIIKYVGDRDLWQFKYPKTRAAIEGLKQSGRMHDYEYWDMLAYHDEALEHCIMKGQVVLDYNRSNNLRFKQSANSYSILDIDGYRAVVYNSTHSVNELAEIFYIDDSLNIDYVISYYVRADGCIKLSLRSRNPGSIDVRIAASRWAAGGHFHSPGANLSPQQSIEFLQLLQGT